MAPCNYSAWSNWSQSCIENPAYTYFQRSVRSANPPYSYCTDLSRTRPCNASDCSLFNYTNVATTCNYDPATTACVNSTTLTTTVFLCTSNASNFTNFLLSEPWPVVQYQTFNIVPCLPECSATSGSPPPPSPPPPLPPCSYSPWSKFSFQCYERVPGDYYQTRSRTLLVENPTCPPITTERSCLYAAGQCQTYETLTSVTTCAYNASHLCANSSRTNTTISYCLSNATNITRACLF